MMGTYQLHEVARERLCGCAKVTRSVSSWFSYRILTILCTAEAVCGANLGGNKKCVCRKCKTNARRRTPPCFQRVQVGLFQKIPFPVSPSPAVIHQQLRKQGYPPYAARLQISVVGAETATLHPSYAFPKTRSPFAARSPATMAGRAPKGKTKKNFF